MEERGGAKTAPRGGGAKGGAWGAILSGAIPVVDRTIDRVGGWFPIYWEWLKDMENCGFKPGTTGASRVPTGLEFPH